MPAPSAVSYKRSRRRTRTYDRADNADEVFASLAAIAAPTGAVLPSFIAGDTPDGAWLVCDGRTLLKADFPDLYAVLAASLGGGLTETATTFDLPDMRGRLPIGAGGGSGISVGTLAGASAVTIGITHLPSHSHTPTDPGHGHSFTPTPHSHTVTDAGHVHTVDDPGHDHTITDPGHSHTAPAAAAAAAEAGATAASVTGGTTSTAATGITVDEATTGLTVESATTGITIANASAGGTVGNATTGITIGNTGGGTPLPILPPIIGINWIIRT